MSGRAPQVTVLMAARDAERHIRGAVRSILGQSFGDFELVIVDDASRDGTARILKALGDPRVRVLVSSRRLCPAGARNLGLRAARGKFIAVMDADDWSRRDRLAVQVKFLRAHPGLDAAGSFAGVAGSRTGSRGILRFPSQPGLVAWSVLFGGWAVCHPSVMVRVEALRKLGGYRKDLRWGEDYDLWSRALFRARVANLPEPLLKKRVWEGSHSFQAGRLERAVVIDSMGPALARLLRRHIPRVLLACLYWLHRQTALEGTAETRLLSAQARRRLSRLDQGTRPRGAAQVRAVEDLLEELYGAFLRKMPLRPEEKRLLTLDLLRKRAFLASLRAGVSSRPGRRSSPR